MVNRDAKASLTANIPHSVIFNVLKMIVAIIQYVDTTRRTLSINMPTVIPQCTD
jgi:hypothetical protein